MSRAAAAWVVIGIVGAGTYLIRASFLLVARRMPDLPPAVRELLRMIPAAALAALVAPTLLRVDGALEPWNPRLLAGLVALVVAWWTRSILATIAVGLVAVVVAERLLF